MGDKKSKEILFADVDFPRDLIEAFQKPLRTNVQPIELGSVVAFEPDYKSGKSETHYGIVLGLDAESQEMQISPIQRFTSSYTSKIMDYDCFASEKGTLTQMGFDHPIVMNISKTQTHKLQDNQITQNNDYLALTRDQDYPLIRAVGKASPAVMKEAAQSLNEYIFTQKKQIAHKPRISDDIHQRNIPSTCGTIAEYGLPELEIH